MRGLCVLRTAGINLERASGEGRASSSAFFNMLLRRILEECRETGADFDSPFEAAVAEAIESIGYEVEPQVGSADSRSTWLYATQRDLAAICSRSNATGQPPFRALGQGTRPLAPASSRKSRLEVSSDLEHGLVFHPRGEQLEKLRQILDAARAQSAHDLQSPLTSHLAAISQEQGEPPQWNCATRFMNLPPAII